MGRVRDRRAYSTCRDRQGARTGGASGATWASCSYRMSGPAKGRRQKRFASKRRTNEQGNRKLGRRIPAGDGDPREGRGLPVPGRDFATGGRYAQYLVPAPHVRACI